MIAGTALFAWLAVHRSSSALLRNFSIQTSAWGVLSLSIAGLGLLRLADRDLTSATGLDRMLWFSIGLDLGIILVGITMAMTGWIVARWMGAVGAGIGVLVQGAGLLVLDLRFAAITARVL